MIKNNLSFINGIFNIKFFEYNIIYIINFLFISSSLALVVVSDYKIYDAFWTPLRSLYTALNNDFWFTNFNQITNYIYDTVHNDSIKIIPSLLEYFFSIPFNYWNPRVSLLLGVLIWILCYVFFTRLLLRIFELSHKNKQILSALLAITFFSSPFFSIRFTILGAIHKTIPILCSIFIAKIIFKEKINYKLTSFDLTKIISLCFIGQYSFVSGIFLWINSILFLLIKNFLARKSVSKLKIYIFAFFLTISFAIYFDLFAHLHLYELTSKNFENLINNTNLIEISFKYISFIATSISVYFNGIYYFGTPYFLILSILNLMIYIFIGYKFIFRKRDIFNNSDLFKISPLLFLISFNLYGVFATQIARRPRYFEARYFCENVILSLSLLSLLVFFLIKVDKKVLARNIVYFTAIFSLSNLIGFIIFTQKYVISPHTRDYYGDSKLFDCLKNEPEPSYENAIKNCKLDEFWGYMRKENTKYHPTIQIDNFEEYSKKIYRVFGNKSSQKKDE